MSVSERDNLVNYNYYVKNSDGLYRNYKPKHKEVEQYFRTYSEDEQNVIWWTHILYDNAYEYIMNIPGLAGSLPDCVIREEDLGKLKLLLNYLAESPTEIILKQQNITQEILNDMEIRN